MTTEARLNITYANQNGDLPDPVDYDALNETLIAVAEEALRTGGVPGIAADPNADLDGFKIQKFPATTDVPVARVMLRPATEFG